MKTLNKERKIAEKIKIGISTKLPMSHLLTVID